MKGEPLSRFQIEQRVESARRHFTASIFWESLGRLLALKLVVEDDDGTVLTGKATSRAASRS